MFIHQSVAITLTATIVIAAALLAVTIEIAVHPTIFDSDHALHVVFRAQTQAQPLAAHHRHQCIPADSDSSRTTAFQQPRAGRLIDPPDQSRQPATATSPQPFLPDPRPLPPAHPPPATSALPCHPPPPQQTVRYRHPSAPLTQHTRTRPARAAATAR